MSRCVEFPPDGYSSNGVSGDELIQLLKLRRESAEEKKKEKRRLKKKARKYEKMHKQKELKQMESLIRDLTVNWVPTPILNEQTESNDQNWLFDTTHRRISGQQTIDRGTPTVANENACGRTGSCDMYPLAQILPTVGTTVMPLTLLF